VIVQEGGYDLATLGGLVRAALDGIQEGLERAERDRPREAARDDKELRHG
jgi:hypothetical protein